MQAFQNVHNGKQDEEVLRFLEHFVVNVNEKASGLRPVHRLIKYALLKVSPL